MAQAADAVAAHGLGFPASAATAAPSFRALRRWPTSCASGRCCGACRAPGSALALPVMQGKGQPLIFRAWTPGDAMDSGRVGHCRAQGRQAGARARHPAGAAAGLRPPRAGGSATAAASTTARCSGLRARKAVVAVGLAYDEQEVDAVPHLDYDQRLDWVLTPVGPDPSAQD